MSAGDPDYPKVAMWSVFLLGLGALFWKVIKPAMASPSNDSPDPNAPGGLNDPANQPTAAGLLAQAGDLVAVPNAIILGTGTPDPVQMRITAASPGGAFVHARIEDPRVPGTPIATNIARGHILRIVSSGSPGVDPGSPGRGPPPPGVRPVLLGDPLELLNGRTYLATIVLSGAEKMFASEEAVAGQLQALGFQQVTVTRSPPADYPSGPPGDFYARGVWGGQDQTGSRPSRIAAAWRI